MSSHAEAFLAPRLLVSHLWLGPLRREGQGHLCPRPRILAGTLSLLCHISHRGAVWRAKCQFGQSLRWSSNGVSLTSWKPWSSSEPRERDEMTDCQVPDCHSSFPHKGPPHSNLAGPMHQAPPSDSPLPPPSSPLPGGLCSAHGSQGSPSALVSTSGRIVQCPRKPGLTLRPRLHFREDCAVPTEARAHPPPSSPLPEGLCSAHGSQGSLLFS
ncbi:uncharacterized protein [Saccopteryx bilineata]|uniref:uncharacterized protein n=1 Tax=Saccopteryx bilineata TaxID=59482 RepID=UPI00338EB7DA